MKLILYVIVISLLTGCSAPGSLSGNSNPNIATVKINLPTVQCGMCQQAITDGLMATDGVKTAYVNLNEEKVLVKFDKSKIAPTDLDQTIAKLGYQAGDIPADAEAYNNLPGCCKMPEDR
jgi:copper chaperone CopZ